MSHEHGLRNVLGPVAADAARRVRIRNVRYAAMPLQEVVEAAELILRAIVRSAEGDNAELLDDHLARMVALRSEQSWVAADVEDAFVEIRAALRAARGLIDKSAPAGTPTADSLIAAAEEAHKRVIELFGRLGASGS